ncbi:MAG: acyltransferase [Clostridia bacterium]|nr:acyltransferase [Clostridia bacterium]
MSLKRYEGLDILKTICAFMVVCIHATFQGSLGVNIASLARAAVPAFFMITGFFYDTIIARGKEKQQLKKILLLCVVSNILFFIMKLLQSFAKDETSKYISETFTLKNILGFFIFNNSMFYYHLWYFGAILYVLLVFLVMRKFLPHWEKIAYIITPLLLICNIVLGKYSLIEVDSYSSNIAVRNFLLTGFPCFTIGLFLKKHENKTEFIKRSNILSVALIVVFVASTFLERMILSRLNATPNREMYLSSVLLAAVLVIVFSKESWNKIGLKITKKIGREYSSLIYIIHPMFIFVVETAVGMLNVKSLYLPVAPIIIFAASTVFSACYCFAKSKVKSNIKPGESK